MKKLPVKDNPKEMRIDRTQKQDQAEGKNEDLYLFLAQRYGSSKKEVFAESDED